ncbi:MAG: LamG-like jellyroll fold domain-containing protein [Planctomycetota bacterium]|jgi:hypothetical protein
MKNSDNSMIRVVNLVLMAFLVTSGYKHVQADFIFGEPINLGPPVNTSRSDGTPCISPDDLSLYFTSNRAGGSGGHDLWVVTRPSKDDAWSSPTNLGSRVNSSTLDYFPCISADGLSLYFYSARSGGHGGGDIWVTTRPSASAPWNNATNMGTAINSFREDVSPNLSSDGLTLIFASDRPGGHGNYDLYISTRPSTNSAWPTAENLGPPINGPDLDVAPSLSSDGLVFFFHSIRPGGYGTYDLYFSRRKSLNDEWSAPVNIGSPVNSSFSELGPSLSGDGRSLYFSDHYINPPRPGGLGIDDIWQVSIEPVVDFDGNRKIDFKDFSILVQYWQQNESMCDIGPTPFGDCIVDIQDVAVLADYWLEDNRLIAHWKLDETEGTVAYDSIGVNDGTLYGDPLWQTAGGKINGTLQFDGIDDYVTTYFVLNPAYGPFSVFAWIKGDAPGQVIISQADHRVGRAVNPGSTWLGTDISEGKLITTLMELSFGPLESDFVITDGQWHHIGLVYDFDQFHRHLYVDGVEVAEDTDFVAGVSSEGGLCFGAEKALDSDSFFSGLIDDVRIYNQALDAKEIEKLAR